MESQRTAYPKLFIGIDIHKRSWKVYCAADLFGRKSFSMAPDLGQLRDYVSKHFPSYDVSAPIKTVICLSSSEVLSGLLILK